MRRRSWQLGEKRNWKMSCHLGQLLQDFSTVVMPPSRAALPKGRGQNPVGSKPCQALRAQTVARLSFTKRTWLGTSGTTPIRAIPRALPSPPNWPATNIANLESVSAPSAGSALGIATAWRATKPSILPSDLSTAMLITGASSLITICASTRTNKYPQLSPSFAVPSVGGNSLAAVTLSSILGYISISGSHKESRRWTTTLETKPNEVREGQVGHCAQQRSWGGVSLFWEP